MNDIIKLRKNYFISMFEKLDSSVVLRLNKLPQNHDYRFM